MLVVQLLTFLEKQGRKPEGQAFATEWVQQNPRDFVVASYVGDVSLQSKDYDAAARWYKRAAKAAPNNPTALNNLAWVLGQTHDPAALGYGQKALALSPDAPEVLDTVGWLYVEQGDLTKGLELLSKASTLAPKDPGIRLNLARALVKAGDAVNARRHLEMLTKLPSDTPERQEAEKLLAATNK